MSPKWSPIYTHLVGTVIDFCSQFPSLNCVAKWCYQNVSLITFLWMVPSLMYAIHGKWPSVLWMEILKFTMTFHGCYVMFFCTSCFESEIVWLVVHTNASHLMTGQATYCPKINCCWWVTEQMHLHQFHTIWRKAAQSEEPYRAWLANRFVSSGPRSILPDNCQ